MSGVEMRWHDEWEIFCALPTQVRTALATGCDATFPSEALEFMAANGESLTTKEIHRRHKPTSKRTMSAAKAEVEGKIRREKEQSARRLYTEGKKYVEIGNILNIGAVTAKIYVNSYKDRSSE